MVKPIISLLESRRIIEAVTQLEAQATELNDWRIQAELESIKQTYHYMLDYTAKGMLDPKLGEVYEGICYAIREIAYKTDFLLDLQHASHFFAQKSKALRNSTIDIQFYKQQLESINAERQTVSVLYANSKDSELPLLTKHQQVIDDLFEYLWTNINWSETDLAQAKELFASTIVQTSELTLFVSAINLSLLLVFDSRKVQFLFHLLESRNLHPLVVDRVYAGLILTIYKHIDFVERATTIRSLYSKAFQDENVSKLQLAFLQFIKTWETDFINRMMREELMPTIIKSQAKNPKGGIQIIDLDAIEQQFDWEDTQNTFKNIIQKMAELQMGGFDVYESTFSQAKQHQFFRHPAHWFYHFGEDVPELELLFAHDPESSRKYTSKLQWYPFFCNSDKYTMVLLMNDFPANMRQQYLDQFKMDQTEQNGETPIDPSLDIANYYHDLYRFISLWDRHNLFDSTIFQRKLNIFDNALLGDMLINDEYQPALIEFLVKYKHYEEAVNIFDAIDVEDLTLDELKQYGYSLDKIGEKWDAYNIYRRALSHDSDNMWLIKRAVSSALEAEEYSEALGFLTETEERMPENAYITYQIGRCQMHLKQYQKALDAFYKALFYSDNSPRIIRSIAWCCFLIGEYTKAQENYNKIPKEEWALTDYLNMGHTYLVQGLLPHALESYYAAYEMVNSHQDFVDIFMHDQSDVISDDKVDPELYRLIPDILLQQYHRK